MPTPCLFSGCEQANIHLVKLEGLSFFAAIGGYRPVTIQNIIDKVGSIGRGQAVRPCDASNRAESGKSRTRPKIPGVIGGMHTSIPGSRYARLRLRIPLMSGVNKDRENRESNRSISALRRVSSTTCSKLGRAPATTNRSSRSSSVNQGGVNRRKGRILLGNPVHRIKRNHEIKLVLEGQGASVCNLKSKVGSGRRNEVVPGKNNHAP